jgi:hypothetical protein
VSTTVTAIISKEWKQRMLIMMLVLGGMGCWFLFDGFVAYPRNNAWASVYFELVEKHGKDTPELDAAWAQVCKERNWSEEKPKKIYTEGDIRTQIILGIIALLGAGAVYRNYSKSLTTTTRLENGIIILPGGEQIALTQVRALSKRRWENKGIADLSYEPELGKAKKFILDDYKYIGAAQILAEVENVLNGTTSETVEEKAEPETEQEA